jgi:succinoglycan biosynthesis transport protein ExoP
MNYIEPPLAHQFPPVPRPAGGEGLDITRLLRTVVRGLPILCGTLVLGLCLGVVSLRYLPTRYTSSVSILIDPKRPGSYGEDGQFVNLFVDNSKIADVELLLVSSELLGRVVDEEHLADDPSFGDAQPSTLRRWLPFLTSIPSFNTPEARHVRAVYRLSQMIHTARVGVTYVINLDVTARSPASAQLLANAVAHEYLDDQIQSRLDAASRDTTWLTTQLKGQRTELINSEAAVEGIRKKYGVLAPNGGPETTVDRQAISQVNEDLIKAQADVAVTGAKYQQALQIRRSGGSVEGLSDVDTSKVIGDLRKQQAEASARLADMSARYSSSFPARRQAEKDRDAVNGQVQLEVSRVLEMLRNDYQTAVAKRDTLQRELAGLVGRVSAADSAEGRVELREAERVAEANRTAYDASLARLREVEQSRTRQDVEARIISQADLPEFASSPKAAICLGAGAVLGLIAGMGLVLLFPYHRNRVVDTDSAEQAFSLPVLAMTPILRKPDLRAGSKQLTISEYLLVKPVSRFAESLRLLRLHLRLTGKGGPKVIQFTSAVPGEGKSTMAAGLAISASVAGIRTVIVDLDFHRPSIGRIFSGQQSEGVFDILLGSSPTDSALARHETLPLCIIDAGSVGEPRTGMIESAKLRALVRELQQRFDLVILDSPPILAISDPLFISGIVDATVMVVAWGATPKKLVDEALTALRNSNASIAGLLLNKVKLEKTGRYGVGYYVYEGFGTA